MALQVGAEDLQQLALGRQPTLSSGAEADVALIFALLFTMSIKAGGGFIANQLM